MNRTNGYTFARTVGAAAFLLALSGCAQQYNWTDATGNGRGATEFAADVGRCNQSVFGTADAKQALHTALAGGLPHHDFGSDLYHGAELADECLEQSGWVDKGM